MQNPVQRITHLRPSEMHSRIIGFLDHELRNHAGFSVREEYPSIFGEFPGGESLVVEVGGRIASHLGFVVREFQHAEYRLKVGLIGSVATAVEWQGHGMATMLVRSALKELKHRGCIVAVLWTDTPDFYQPLGFERAGRERDFRFSADAVPEVDTPSVPFEASKHAHLIWRLYLKHAGRLDRSLEEQKRLCRIPQAKVFVTEGQGGITSYLAIQKGADFTDYIHEWGGELQDLKNNIAWVQRNAFRERPLTLIAPAYYDLAPLRAISSEEWGGVLGMMRVLDKGHLMAVYTGYLKKHGVQADWRRESDTLVVQGKETRLVSEADCLKQVFGAEETPSHPLLPFFLWGFDSI